MIVLMSQRFLRSLESHSKKLSCRVIQTGQVSDLNVKIRQGHSVKGLIDKKQ